MIISNTEVVPLHEAEQHFGTMAHDTISTPALGPGRQRHAPDAPRRRRFLIIAASLSIGVHVLAALLILFLPRVVPRDVRPREQGTVELLMVEQKGAKPQQPTPPVDNKPAPARPTETATTEPKKDEAAAPPIKESPAYAVTDATEPAPPEQAPPEQASTKPAEVAASPAPKQPPRQPAPPRQQEAPVFDLAGTGSESNATVLGDHVLPAMPDDRFRNRPPVYPAEAEMLGQHGSVVVVIHVGANGLATGADIVESSGVGILDQAAVIAVRKWHFRPAMKEGRTIPFDMPFRFIFDAK